jgi:hypothetical protein
MPDSSPSTPYRPWRQLLPHWWMPIVGEGSDGGATYGASSNGRDVRGQHVWAAQLTRHPSRGEMEGSAIWRVRALPALGALQPTLDVSTSQGWDRFSLVDSARRPVGELGRRARFGTVALSLARPRVRTSTTLSLGAQVERRAFVTRPDSLLGALDPLFARGVTYPSVFASGVWSNTMRPWRGISTEDGITLGATVQRRWRDDRRDLGSWRSTGELRAYQGFRVGWFCAPCDCGARDRRAHGSQRHHRVQHGWHEWCAGRVGAGCDRGRSGAIVWCARLCARHAARIAREWRARWSIARRS